MKRLLALLAAAAMVGGALYVRAERDADDGSDGGGGGGGDRVALVCDPVLREACEGVGGDVEVSVEDAAATAQRLLDGDAPPDAWLAPGPWPAMVEALAPPTDLPDARPLGSTRLGVVGQNDLDGCGWRCLGLRVARNQLELGWTGVDGATGPALLAAVAGALVGRPDYATNDLGPDVRSTLAAFAEQARSTADPALRSVQTSGAAFQAAVTLGAGGEDLLRRRSTPLVLLYPEPVVAVEAVLAGGDGDLAGELRTALADLGWDEAGAAPSGLPEPGVLAALWDSSR